MHPACTFQILFGMWFGTVSLWFGCLLVLVKLVIPPSESDECNATLLWAGWGRPLFR